MSDAPSRSSLPLSERVALLVATGFGAGRLPRMPGTVGTAAAMPLWLMLAQLPFWLQALSTLAFAALAVHAAAVAGRHFGQHDDQRIVSDEIAGTLVTMLGVAITPTNIVAGFLLFRLFDITKPWPAGWVDRRMNNALGNVLDDVCAGLYARLGMAGLAWITPWVTGWLRG
jgi:phosphatidylglycerophosphatase A